MKRNHVKIAFMLLFVILINYSPALIDDIFVFINNISENGINTSDIDWIIHNSDLVFVPFAVWLGALFPDIDFWWVLRRWHRKLLHNFFAVLFSALLIIAIFHANNRFYHGLYVTGAFLLGCFSHIAADCITPFGTWIFWPVSKKFALRWIVTVGSWKEKAIMRVLWILFIIYMIAYVYLVYIAPIL